MSSIVYLLLCGFCSERLHLPLCAWDELRYFLGLPFIFVYSSISHSQCSVQSDCLRNIHPHIFHISSNDFLSDTVVGTQMSLSPGKIMPISRSVHVLTEVSFSVEK